MVRFRMESLLHRSTVAETGFTALVTAACITSMGFPHQPRLPHAHLICLNTGLTQTDMLKSDKRSNEQRELSGSIIQIQRSAKTLLKDLAYIFVTIKGPGLRTFYF